ncbi:hypothetical protein MKW98_005266, partial [Papaver atlanticum]
IAAGSPNNYYLNPSENLWKIASKWSVVEYQDVIVLTIYMRGLAPDGVYISVEGKFININIGQDGYKMPAGYADKIGMKNFTVELNPNFLQLGVTCDYTKASEGISRWYIFKLNAEDIKNNVERMHVLKLTPEEIKNYAERMNDSEPKAEENKNFYLARLHTPE